MTSNTTSRHNRGLFEALAAYAIWGTLPLYIYGLRDVPPFELVGWRSAFTLPMCLLILAATRRTYLVRQTMGNPRILGALAVSALLIGANWVIYAYAVQQGHVLAASLGYYINPLVSVIAGTVIFRERLSRAQWLAVTIAALGVALLAWGSLNMLWISLSLALTFGGYGIVRKLTPVDALPGLTVETILLFVPAVAAISWSAAGPQGMALGRGVLHDSMLLSAGIITATPLLLFTSAARKLDLSLLGFIQFVAPTTQFILGLTWFGEPLKPAQIACFVLIWLAIGIFCYDMFMRRDRRAPQ